MEICLGCHRHVRSAPCPFCGGSATRAGGAGPAAIHVGIRRAALLVGLASAAGCSASSPTPPPDVVSLGDVYGTPADVAMVDAGTPPPDVVSLADIYGTPPPPDVVSAPDV